MPAEVASTLLGMAFVYDIFFVFISPYFFEESVMVKVATGKGPTKDADYCEKYPGDEGCASTSLPMLLMLPSSLKSRRSYTPPVPSTENQDTPNMYCRYFGFLKS